MDLHHFSPHGRDEHTAYLWDLDLAQKAMDNSAFLQNDPNCPQFIQCALELEFPRMKVQKQTGPMAVCPTLVKHQRQLQHRSSAQTAVLTMSPVTRQLLF